MLLGSGAFVVEKFLGPLFSRFSNSSSAKTDSVNKAGSRDFRVVENNKGLSIYDSSGEEILQIDKGA